MCISIVYDVCPCDVITTHCGVIVDASRRSSADGKTYYRPVTCVVKNAAAAERKPEQ